jgi:hypothetical protein
MPLSVQALLQATDADDAVARALLAKGNAVLMRLRAEGELVGRREGEDGLRQALEALCAVLDIELTEARRAVLEKATLADLRGLVEAIKVQRRWPGH